MAPSRLDSLIGKPWGVRKILSADEEARLLAESREKACMDFEDRYDGAYHEGEQKGRREVALNLLRKKCL